VNRRLHSLFATASVAALASAPSPVSAQAFTPPKGLGAVTLAWQYVDNTGHRLSDGYFRKTGQSVTTSALLDLEYGVTDRLSANFGIPYVFAKYTGALPALSGTPADACRCWHSGFQDFSLGARYRLGDDTWAVTPLVRFGQPSHAYPHKGEAVVGKQLSEAQVGVSAGVKLAGFLSRANVQAAYTYAFVEKALEDISVNRSNGTVDLGYAVSRRLYLRTSWLWQYTHGGLRLGSVTGNPFPLPGELNTAERRAEGDQLRRVQWMQMAGGLSFSAGPVDVFASFTKYVWGRDAHNGQVYNLGATWYLDLSK
jgi:hypothetical protein